MAPFLWAHRDGVDPQALERLCSRFPRPRKPMGEAWFMGDDRLLHVKLLGDWDLLTAADLRQPLDDILSGTVCFGPLEEWTSWYHFLLGALLSKHRLPWLDDLFEALVCAFMVLHPHGAQRGPFEGFREDALRTLGRCLMAQPRWDGWAGEGGQGFEVDDVTGWWQADGAVSASMFFCLKYLPEAMVAPWLRSALSVADPRWRARLMVWLVGAHGLLNDEIRWPSELPECAAFGVSWEGAHFLKPGMACSAGTPPADAFIPPENRLQAMRVLREFFTEDRYLAWLASFDDVRHLGLVLAAASTAFETLYVERPGRSG